MEKESFEHSTQTSRTATSSNRSTTPYSRFLYAIATEATLSQYKRHLKEFLQFVDLLPPQEKNSTNLMEQASLELYKKSKEDITWFNDSLISYILYQKSRILKKEISGSTLRNMYKPVKLFCDMNDILLNWRVITRGIPVGKRSANDRTPTLDEIHRLLEHSDVRMKPIVLVMVSSGIRLGAWAFLKWKHITPVENNGIIIAAKVIVYAEEPDQYFTFITPEAYNALKDWMEFRSSYGEVITGSSWLMRDIWRTTSIPYGTRKGRAKFPKKLSHVAIRGMINRALFKQNIRASLLQKGEKHEFKAVHGFRKYFKTVCEQGMKPANVELLIGHDIGISTSYYKPTESQLLEDYLKVVNSLTIDKAFKLQEKLDILEKEKDEFQKFTIDKIKSLESMFEEAQGDRKKFSELFDSKS